MLLVCGLVFAVWFSVMWQVQHAWNRKPPDVAAFAARADTRAADKDAARADSAALAALKSALPWAVPLGTSVADSCATQQENPDIGRRIWAPVSCVRTTVAYVAFDGDIRSRLHQLDAALGSRSWTGESSPTTLAATATWMRRPSSASLIPGEAMTSRFTELVIDCHDPQRLAAFWCEVLDFTVLDSSEGKVEIGSWEPTVEAVRGGQMPPTLLFIRVPEGKTVKNRLHLDVSPIDAGTDDEVARLLGLGATRVDLGQEGRARSWVVMADPEGNEFDVLRTLAPTSPLEQTEEGASTDAVGRGHGTSGI
ncbi:Catechol 2,3-dioxygenase [Actinacidiphila paucisporea]|uniref:Catechol 2,3-dioxygenase n=2 Tax=Actinacidiphila paucisporea TaxID=310782 RepID=A0A1M7NP32_9ACTN|nr:Catechol 2,3-dioxygenase [Actinacidiphila paucisporea]